MTAALSFEGAKNFLLRTTRLLIPQQLPLERRHSHLPGAGNPFLRPRPRRLQGHSLVCSPRGLLVAVESITSYPRGSLVPKVWWEAARRELLGCSSRGAAKFFPP